MTHRLYHVSPAGYGPGGHFTRGRYGSAARQFGPATAKIESPQLGAVMWEMAMETARLALAPEAVSRLDCLFTWETLDLARAFRDRFRRGSAIYEVEPLSDARVYRGDFGLISNNVPSGAFVDFMPPIAVRYWTEPPGEQVEVLVGGPVNVCGVVDHPTESI